MNATIDKAGRVVIPASIRSRAGFGPGARLKITIDEDGSVRLERCVSGPRVVRHGKRWIVQPTVPTEDVPEVDVAELVAGERDRWPV